MSQPSIQLGWDDASLAAGAVRSARHVENFEKSAHESLDRLGDFGKEALGFLGIGLGVEGLKSIAEEFERIGTLAKRLDSSPEAIQRIGRQARLTGSDVETIANALSRTNREIAQGNAADAFKELGINTADYLKLDADKQVVVLAAALQDAEGNGKGLAATYDLFGRSAAELLPLLRSNVEALRDLSNIRVLDEGQIERITQFGDALTNFTENQKAGLADFALSFVDFSKAVASGLAGTFSAVPFTEGFEKAAAEMKKLEEEEKASANRRRDARKAAAAAAGTATLKGALDTERGKTGDAEASLRGQLELVDKVRRARENAVRLEETAADVRKRTGADSDASLRADIESEKAKQALLTLEKEYGEEVAKSTKEEADKAEKAQKEAAARAESLGHFKAELAILNEQAAGHDKKAAAMQRSLKIAEEAQRLMKDTGVSEAEALKLAKQHADLEDKIANRKKGGIHGYRQGQASTRTEDNPFRGLDELARLNQVDANGNRLTAFQDKFGGPNRRTPGLDNLARLQDRSQPAFDTGVTRRASAADRAASHSAATPPDHGVEITRLLSSIDKHFADATRG